MHDLAGFGLATAALVLFGLYMVPRKLTKQRDLPFALSMCVGVVCSTVLMSLWRHGQLLPRGDAHALGLAFLCGPIWYGGVLCYAISVTEMGLALSTPIKNTTAVLGTLIGLVYFGEWRETHWLPCLVGALLVVLCAVILGRASDNESVHHSSVNGRGLLAALGAAVLFAAYTAPFKLAQRAGLDTVTLVAYMGLGTLAGALVCFALLDRRWAAWWRASRRDHAMALLCGLLWVLAVMLMAEAITRIGLAITWPYTNLNTLVTVACGIFLFHEINVRRFGRTILLGLVTGIVGIALLGLSRW